MVTEVVTAAGATEEVAKATAEAVMEVEATEVEATEEAAKDMAVEVVSSQRWY